MFRRFLIAVLIFLVAVVVVADRIGAIVGAHVLAHQVQKDEHLTSRPSASIGGFPFLTQAFGGNYKNVTITANDVPVDGVTVTTVKVHLHGVHLPFHDVIHDSVSQVPVDRVDGSALVSFAAANSYLTKHLTGGSKVTLGPGAGNTTSVVDRFRLAGKTYALHGVGNLSVSDSVFVVAVSHLSGTTSAAGPAYRAALRIAAKRLRIAIPLQTLPFQLNVTSVSVTDAGLTGTGTANHIVLGSHKN